MEISIYLDKRVLRKKGYPITIGIYTSIKDRAYPVTGFYAFEDEWDDERQEPTKKHPMYFVLFEYILELKIKINKLLAKKTYVSAQEAKQFLLSGNPDSLTNFWEEYIAELRKNNKEGLAKFYYSCLLPFKKFKKDVLFSEINYLFLIKYRDYTLNRKDDKGKNQVSPNGIIVYLRGLRAVYNEAVRRKVYTPDDFTNHFKGVMPEATPTKDKYFTISEMRKVVQAENKTKHYDIAMLCFLLGGIDYVDLENLKYEHIKNGRVKFQRFKGGTTELIDNKVFPEAEEILNKYKDDSGYLMYLHKFNSDKSEYRDNYVRKFRNWLKKIGITSYFSSKTPRYTFINIGKELLLNREIIMELTGHSLGDVHSIYEGKFPYHIKDEVHRQIIDAVLK